MCCPLGPISIRPRLEVRLEHRFEDELERTLHHSVPDRRDRQDADFAPVFRYLLFPGWEWLVGAPGQFVAQLLEQQFRKRIQPAVARTGRGGLPISLGRKDVYGHRCSWAAIGI